MTTEPQSRRSDNPRIVPGSPWEMASESPADGSGPEPTLNEDEKMLLALRDELYEGRWDLFESDLRARLNGEPHVFEIGPVSDRLRDTIESHLRIMKTLRARNI